MRVPPFLSAGHPLERLLLTLGLSAAMTFSAWATGPWEVTPAKAGQPPRLKFTSLDGREVDLNRWKGKVVVVDFWATWCGPCMKELPTLKACYERWHEQGLEIAGVNLDKRREAVEYVIRKEEIPWPHYFDGRGLDDAFTARTGVDSLPTVWLIDRRGNRRERDERSNLAKQIEALLAEK